MPVEPGAPAKEEFVAAPLTEKAGERIGRYRLLEEIGHGGCGVVYMAEQEEPVRRRVALKVIKLGMDTRQVVARFEAERQTLALMDHPNIAKVLDGGATEKGRPYFVMELVGGIKITDYCDQNQLTTRQRLELFVQVCRAIQHAHQKGIIHRDIKPSNVLVSTQDGMPVPKVIDFGIAKATQGRLTDQTLFTAFEQFVGTPAYVSPEQAQLGGLDVDTRSDIYSLGVLLYELLTGKTPFDAKELLAAGLETMRQTICEKEPLTPSTRLRRELASRPAGTDGSASRPANTALDRDLDWIVMKCLEKDRSRRYETANGLAMDIDRHLKNEPVVARPPSRLYEFQKTVRRHKFGFAATASVVVALALGLGVALWESVDKGRAYSRAVKAENLQSKLRQQAEANESLAREEAQRADIAAKDLKKALAASDLSHALGLSEQGKYQDALPFLTRSLLLDPDSQAAQTRLATLLIYHRWTVTTAVLEEDRTVRFALFSHDGEWVLVVSDGIARVFDSRSGRPIVGPLSFPGDPTSVQISSDQSRIIVVSNAGLARVWDSKDGRQLAEFKYGTSLAAADFSPDATRVVTAENVGRVKVCDIDGGLPLYELKHNEPVTVARFAPDGRRIITVSEEGAARVWDAQSGRQVTEFQLAKGLEILEFSSEGQRILTYSSDQTARVWNIGTGEMISEVKNLAGVNLAHFSPEGRRIFIGTKDGTARVWDALSAQPVTELMTHPARLWLANFNPAGSQVVTAAIYNNTAWLWDLQPGAPPTTILAHNGWVGTAEFSPDGKKVITTSHDRAARIWESVGGEPVFQPLRHTGVVRWAEFSPDSTRIVTASDDETARVWDARNSMPLTEPLKHNGIVRHAAFSPDGTRIVTASQDGTARVWDAQSGLPLTGPLKHGGIVWSAEFSPEGKRVVTASGDGTARVWDAQTGLPLTGPLKHGDIVWSAQFSPEGRRVVTSSSDGTARVWDAQNGLPLAEPLKHGGTVWLARFSPDGRRIATASDNRSACVWDTQDGWRLTAQLKHTSGVRSAQFTPDSGRIVTASDDGTARVWDAHSGLPLTTPLQHGKDVRWAVFSADGSRVGTASADGSARVWDAQTGLPLTEPFKHRADVRKAQFSPDGRRIVICSGNAAIAYDIAPSAPRCPEWLAYLTEAICGQAFNEQGGLQATEVPPRELWSRVTQELEKSPAEAPWTQLGRWLLADPSKRTISPFSNLAPAEYVERRLKDSWLEPLEPALQLARGNNELWGHTFEAACATRSALALRDQISTLVAAGNLSEAGIPCQRLRALTRQVGMEDSTRWLADMDNVATINNYAWLLAVHGDPKVRDGVTAVTFAERAVRLGGRNDAGRLDTLAAAYAEVGRFDEAISVQREALGLATQEPEKAELAARLKLYESRTPYRAH